MNYYVLRCGDYAVEAKCPTLSAALGIAQELEATEGDGLARVISLDGRIVADTEGSCSDPERYVDAATQTGMYDDW